MKKIITAFVAAAALAVPGAALANHATDVDGPAVSSVNGVCHGKPGKLWRAQQVAAGTLYYNAFISTGYLPYATMAVEHFAYVAAYDAMCRA